MFTVSRLFAAAACLTLAAVLPPALALVAWCVGVLVVLPVAGELLERAMGD